MPTRQFESVKIPARASRIRTYPYIDLLTGASDDLARLADLCGVRVERLDERRGLSCRGGPVVALQRLAHARQRLHAITGVEARCVDRVLIPGTFRQARRGE